MSNQAPQTLKGFRDFLPAEKRKRDYVENKMRMVFERFGFAPLETPTLEYASLLLGKYGNEADKLVYTFTDKGDRQVGLRYDQTVPTTRVLVEHQHELPKYFRRYQIQDVFRADKPQKGRYREFKQCDCDIFASTSPIADAEILAVYYAVFKEIGLNSLQIEVNDRQTLLAMLSPFATESVDVYSIIQTIDKSDKISPAEVVAELVSKGLSETAAAQAVSSIENAEMSDNLRDIFAHATALGVPKEALIFNPKIARGLDYYTGMIFEGKIAEYAVGSVGGGGRYDHLIENLSGVDIPAVGFGIGFDRTVEAADQLGCIPQDNVGTQVLMTIFSADEMTDALSSATQLRQAGIRTEVYPTSAKLAAQFKYADQLHIPFVIIIGEQERAEHKVTLKDMKTGEQKLLPLAETIAVVLR